MLERKVCLLFVSWPKKEVRWRKKTFRHSHQRKKSICKYQLVPSGVIVDGTLVVEGAYALFDMWLLNCPTQNSREETTATFNAYISPFQLLDRNVFCCFNSDKKNNFSASIDYIANDMQRSCRNQK